MLAIIAESISIQPNMAVDIREIDPCDDCRRQNYKLRRGANPETAGAYLLFSALDAIDEDSVPDDVEQGASAFLHESAPSGSKGAVSYCGRLIAKGVCSDWKIEEGTIVHVEPTSPVFDERGFTPDFDLEPDDVFERSSFYDD